MNSRLRRLIFNRAILLIFIILVLIILSQSLFSQIYVTKGLLFPDFFKEPFETAVFVLKDGRFYTFSSHHEHGIYLYGGGSVIIEYLKKEGINIEDVAIVIHNHLTPASFSPINHRFFHQLQQAGFKGFFAIYYPFSKKVRIRK